MRYLIILSLTYLTQVAVAQSPLREQLKALDKQRFMAQVSKDSVALRALLSDQLVYTHSSGLVETKAEYIRGILSGRWDYRTIDGESATVRFFGPTAIVTGRARMSLQIDGKPLPLYMAYTDVWHRTAKTNWQLVSWAASRLPID